MTNDTVWAYRWKLQHRLLAGLPIVKIMQYFQSVFVRKMSGLTTASDNNYEASGVHIYDYRYAELQLNLAGMLAGY